MRDLARHLGLHDLAALPAAPCLSSRIETGLRVTPKRLEIVEVIERHLRDQNAAATIRCRVRPHRLENEVESQRVDDVRETYAHSIEQLLVSVGASAAITFEPYHQGSAFVHEARS